MWKSGLLQGFLSNYSTNCKQARATRQKSHTEERCAAAKYSTYMCYVVVPSNINPFRPGRFSFELELEPLFYS